MQLFVQGQSSREFSAGKLGELRKLGEVSSVGGMVDLSRDSDPDFTALYGLLGLEAPVTKFDGAGCQEGVFLCGGDTSPAPT